MEQNAHLRALEERHRIVRIGGLHTIERIARFGAAVFVADARNFEDVPRILRSLGVLTGNDVEPVVRAYRAKLERLRREHAGERKHLLSKAITLDTFTSDIVNVIEAEELSDVILVGHSFGGNAISGTADTIPGKIRHLVYLDSLMVEGGKAPFDNLPPDVVAVRRKAAEETSGGLSLPAPPPSAFGVSETKDTEWVKRRLTPHPFGTYTSPLNIKGPVGNNLPRTYIACTNPSYAALQASRNWVKAQQGWRRAEIATGHDAMVMAPDELTRMLIGVSS